MSNIKKSERIKQLEDQTETLREEVEDLEYVNGQLATEVSQLNNDLDSADIAIEAQGKLIQERDDEISKLLDIAADGVVLELSLADFSDEAILAQEEDLGAREQRWCQDCEEIHNGFGNTAEEQRIEDEEGGWCNFCETYHVLPNMTLEERILELVEQDWQNVSNLVRELGVSPKDIKEELRYLEEEGKISYYNFQVYHDTIGKPRHELAPV